MPTGVTKVWVTACAGGQGGWGYNTGAAGGNGGEWIFRQPYNVTAGQTISITIGAGGRHNYSSSMSNQVAGGNTVIGSLVTLLGGGVSGNTNGGHGAYCISNVYQYLATDGFAGGGVSQNNNCGGGGSLGRGMNADAKLPCTVGYGGGGLGQGSGADARAGNGIVIIEW